MESLTYLSHLVQNKKENKEEINIQRARVKKYLDYIKIFDKVLHKETLELLGKLDFFGKDTISLVQR